MTVDYHFCLYHHSKLCYPWQNKRDHVDFAGNRYQNLFMEAACTALKQAQSLQLAEVPLAPKQEGCQAKLWLTTKAGTLEIMDADRFVLDQVLQAMIWFLIFLEVSSAQTNMQ